MNAVIPGPTRSEGVADFFGKLAKERGMSEEEMEAQFITLNRPTSLLRRLATPEEVANMVVYVCSPQASATTGAALRVDGGVIRSIARRALRRGTFEANNGFARNQVGITSGCDCL